MGGEKSTDETIGTIIQGSPPRRRGKERRPLGPRKRGRITPAWAGKRPVAHAGKELIEDHPRVGGEKISFFLTGCSPKGSPPRRRGKVCFRHLVEVSFGITPRMGGEKILEPSMGVGNFGSPPRGRGKVDSVINWEKSGRITPAWAGKSFCDVSCNISIWDHPRVGGEKWEASSS